MNWWNWKEKPNIADSSTYYLTNATKEAVQVDIMLGNLVVLPKSVLKGLMESHPKETGLPQLAILATVLDMTWDTAEARFDVVKGWVNGGRGDVYDKEDLPPMPPPGPEVWVEKGFPRKGERDEVD